MLYRTILFDGRPWIVTEPCEPWQVRAYMRQLQRSDAIGAGLTYRQASPAEVSFFEINRARIACRRPHGEKLVAVMLP